MEEFKDIEKYKGIYQISNLGRVRRIRSGNFSRFVSGSTRKDGYQVLRLRNKGDDGDFYLHRLLAEAHIPNPNNYKYVNHIDGDPSNNKLENLEWVTVRENISHGFKTKDTTSKYTGVYLNRRSGKWRSCIRIEGKKQQLGTFNTELGAYLAYVGACERNGITNRYANG